MIGLVKANVRDTLEAGKSLKKRKENKNLIEKGLAWSGWFGQSHDHGWSWTMNDPAKKRIRRLEEIDASVKGKDGRSIKKKRTVKKKGKEGERRETG